jgi:hypothetical protein
MIAPEETMAGYLPSSQISAALGYETMLSYGGWSTYSATNQTETKDNSGTIAVGGEGILMTTGGADGNDNAWTSLRSRTLALGEIYVGIANLSISDADKVGMNFGFSTATTAELQTADAADGVYYAKGKAAATVVGRVVSNAGTAADTGTLLTLADGVAQTIKVQFCVESATSAWGKWIVQSSTGAITETPFTEDQITALLAMYNTTAAVLGANFGIREGAASADTCSVSFLYAGVKK